MGRWEGDRKIKDQWSLEGQARGQRKSLLLKRAQVRVRGENLMGCKTGSFRHL